jgi:hypothetical protein
MEEYNAAIELRSNCERPVLCFACIGEELEQHRLQADCTNPLVDELVGAIDAMFKEPHIKDFYEGHKKMDMALADEVPRYKEDCESITAAFEALIEARKEITK